MPLVEKPEMSEEILVARWRGARQCLRALCGQQSVHTEITEKLRALCVGGFETRRARRKLAKQAAAEKDKAPVRPSRKHEIISIQERVGRDFWWSREMEICRGLLLSLNVNENTPLSEDSRGL